jgi:hypothetical protein
MSDLEDAIELVRIGAGKVGYRSYPGTGGIWAGNNDGLADAVFVDWVLDGRLAPRRAQEPAIDGRH